MTKPSSKVEAEMRTVRFCAVLTFIAILWISWCVKSCKHMPPGRHWQRGFEDGVIEGARMEANR